MVQPWKKLFGKAIAREPLEIEAGVTGTTAEFASLLTRAFERMLEQFFNCFTDGIEL